MKDLILLIMKLYLEAVIDLTIPLLIRTITFIKDNNLIEAKF